MKQKQKEHKEHAQRQEKSQPPCGPVIEEKCRPELERSCVQAEVQRVMATIGKQFLRCYLFLYYKFDTQGLFKKETKILKKQKELSNVAR